jgi:GNAT superfamily N-acetyltransferase
MQCKGAAKLGVFKWTITRRGPVINCVMQSNNRDIEGIHFRVSQQEDQDFLWKALYHALSVPPGSPLPNREVVNLPILAQYVDSWMKRPGDLGIVAIEDKTQIGAAWIRKWIGSTQGYGFVDPTIPELSISLPPEYRGIGIGTKLLGLLLEKVSQQYEAVSLSVANYNTAKRLYERHGFQEIGEAKEDSITMIFRFKAG